MRRSVRLEESPAEGANGELRMVVGRLREGFQALDKPPRALSKPWKNFRPVLPNLGQLPTRRRWTTGAELAQLLWAARELAPQDPLCYDYSLSHWGMSEGRKEKSVQCSVFSVQAGRGAGANRGGYCQGRSS